VQLFIFVDKPNVLFGIDFVRLFPEACYIWAECYERTRDQWTLGSIATWL
jgi:hypothetical protein